MMGALAPPITGKVQVRLTTRAVVVATAIGLAAAGPRRRGGGRRHHARAPRTRRAPVRPRGRPGTGLQQELARAVESGGIEVHFQPIVDLRTSRTMSLEPLARWRGPDGALVPADVFVPIAEETGAIMEIGRVVLRQACRAVQHWRAAVPGHRHLGVAVNVSVHQVLSGLLYDDVVEALRDSGLAPSTLTLEIIESTAIEDSERVAAESRGCRPSACGSRSTTSRGLLLARLPHRARRRHAQDRPHDPGVRRDAPGLARGRDRRARPHARPDRGRGGRGDPGTPRLGAAGVLRRGAGLPLLPTAARGRGAAVPAGVRP
jgi:hypothetical protein